jgi:SPP1 gp7 family putative phage head morphogenesis protein
MAALSPAQILSVFGMPPKAAVAYLEQKGLRITGDWHEMLNEDHAAAFSVANAAKLDVVQDLYGAVLDAVRNGTTERNFIKRLTPILQSKGWWGKELNEDGTTTQLGSPRRLQTIYRTNTQSAYMAGRYHHLMKSVKTHPYWKYIAILDTRTRRSHSAMNGRIFQYDDPVWTFAFPPNGYNCRCRVVAISQYDVDEAGAAVESSAGRILKREVQIGKDADGNPLFSDVTGINLPTKDGKSVNFFTDAGFDVNQGMAATEHAARIFGYKVAKASPEVGAVAMNAARDWLMPELLKDYQAWAKTTIKDKQAKNSFRVIGAMSPEVVKGLGNIGVTPASAAITLRDAELEHLYRNIKVEKEKSLTLNELLDLPELLAKSVAVIWDARRTTMIYVLDTEKAKKVVVRVEYTIKLNEAGVRQTAVVNSVRTAGLADAGDLKQYTLLEGSFDW